MVEPIPSLGGSIRFLDIRKDGIGSAVVKPCSCLARKPAEVIVTDVGGFGSNLFDPVHHLRGLREAVEGLDVLSAGVGVLKRGTDEVDDFVQFALDVVGRHGVAVEDGAED